MQYFQCSLVLTAACHVRSGVEFSIHSVISELRRLWISEFGVGVNKHVMFSLVRQVQSREWTLAEEAEEHRAPQEAGAAPCLLLTEYLCYECASTVGTKSIPHQGRKIPKIHLGVSSPRLPIAPFPSSLCE